MKHIKVLGAAIALLTIGGSSVAFAQGRGRGRGEVQNQQQPVVPPAEQQRRIKEEQQRAAVYQKQLDQQVRVVQQKTAVLEKQRRQAALKAQQDYARQLAEQQQHLQTRRDYENDPYIRTPVQYRYVVAGSSRQTNDYGAQVLRDAVNRGYQQGYVAGEADRQDRWRSNYQNSPAYQDANYGYTGQYVAQGDYNYYFRQGFKRGYQDGYAARHQYGTSAANGSPSILSNVLTAILGLVKIP